MGSLLVDDSGINVTRYAAPRNRVGFPDSSEGGADLHHEPAGSFEVLARPVLVNDGRWG